VGRAFVYLAEELAVLPLVTSITPNAVASSGSLFHIEGKGFDEDVDILINDHNRGGFINSEKMIAYAFEGGYIDIKWKYYNLELPFYEVEHDDTIVVPIIKAVR